MNIVGIEKQSMLNGDGFRTVLWCSGCSHHCEGCHNPETWNPKYGHEMTEEDMKEILESLDSKWISGLTLSGGDPLYIENREKTTEIAKEVKTAYPNKTIWLYTGYEYEDISDLEILNYVDVIVVGPFVKELKDVSYEWAGSTNQRVMRKQADGKFI